MQDFDKLDSILKDYKQFMSQSPGIDKTLPAHVHLSGFVEEGLQIHVHVSLNPILGRLGRQGSIADKVPESHADASLSACLLGA